jgi:UDP-N-acetylmuramate--alanine ligase
MAECGAVTSPLDPNAAARAAELARAGLKRPGAPSEPPPRLLVVDAERQTGLWFEDGRALAQWPVSTAALGIGGKNDSYQTPPGWHRIDRKIGENAPSGTRFVAREPNGEIWSGEESDDDLILTRVLTLNGLEEGVNAGPGCDSFERYIYIHGTNQETLLGRPASHGCVRMANPDVCALFERIGEGDYVFIAPPVPSAIPDPFAKGRFHYAGLGGSGMSALAQFQAMKGGTVSGSDRAFDNGERT